MLSCSATSRSSPNPPRPEAGAISSSSSSKPPGVLRLSRLEQRGVPRADAERRMEAQASDEERRALATHLIDNRGDLPALERQVDEMWRDLERRRDAPDPG